MMRGGKKGAVQEEQATIDFAYASVVTTSSIEAGDEFTTDNLWVKRPGTGEFLADSYPRILGKHATQAIEEDTLLKKEHVSDD